MPAPPPIKYIPNAVLEQLNAARDSKARTRAAIDAAEARLANAEQRTTAQQYDAAAAELGVYQAIITDALVYLRQPGKSDGKTRDLAKLLEQALFRHSGRVEAMRRETPSEYAGNVRAALKHVRDTRTAALDAFYGNSILREAAPDKSKAAPTNNPPPNPADQPHEER